MGNLVYLRVFNQIPPPARRRVERPDVVSLSPNCVFVGRDKSR